MCCSFFAGFGALFLFLVAGLLRSNYPNIHIHASAEELYYMSAPVTWAGAFFSMAQRRGQAARAGSAAAAARRLSPFARPHVRGRARV